MKAKIKATGEEIIVEPYGDEFAQILPDGGYEVYTKQELVFPNEIDWQQVYIQAAIAAMQTVDDHVSTVDELAERCVRYADALVAELQKKGGEQ